MKAWIALPYDFRTRREVKGLINRANLCPPRTPEMAENGEFWFEMDVWPVAFGEGAYHGGGVYSLPSGDA